MTQPLFSRRSRSFAFWGFLILSVSMVAGCPQTSGDTDAGTSASDAGSVDNDAGLVAPDAGNSGTDAGISAADAGPITLDAGSTATDAGIVTADAGSTTADAGSTTVDAGTSNDAGSTPPRDECALNEDCNEGDLCLGFPLSDPDAIKICVSQGAPPRIRCDDNTDPGEGDCCLDTDCTPGDHGAVCVSFSVNYCGGVRPPDYNTCRSHECSVDADCGAASACILAGAFGLAKNTCVPSFCGSDADCTTGTGGECRTFPGDCSGVGGFMCTYDESACRTSQDCPQQGANQFECLANANGVPECVEVFARP